MDKFTAQVFARLQSVMADAGVNVDAEKAADAAKALGLIEGIRKVGGHRPTDLGFQFAGIDATEVEKVKELAAKEAELARALAKAEKLKQQLGA